MRLKSSRLTLNYQLTYISLATPKKSAEQFELEQRADQEHWRTNHEQKPGLVSY